MSTETDVDTHISLRVQAQARALTPRQTQPHAHMQSQAQAHPQASTQTQVAMQPHAHAQPFFNVTGGTSTCIQFLKPAKRPPFLRDIARRRFWKRSGATVPNSENPGRSPRAQFRRFSGFTARSFENFRVSFCAILMTPAAHRTEF